MTDEHCKDCCCARSWKALGVTGYTGKSIPEHIEELVSAKVGNKRDGSTEVVEAYQDAESYIQTRHDTLKEVAGLARDKATAMDNGRAIISFSVMDAFAQELERMAGE